MGMFSPHIYESTGGNCRFVTTNFTGKTIAQQIHTKRNHSHMAQNKLIGCNTNRVHITSHNHN